MSGFKALTLTDRPQLTLTDRPQEEAGWAWTSTKGPSRWRRHLTSRALASCTYYGTIANTPDALRRLAKKRGVKV